MNSLIVVIMMLNVAVAMWMMFSAGNMERRTRMNQLANEERMELHTMSDEEWHELFEYVNEKNKKINERRAVEDDEPAPF